VEHQATYIRDAVVDWAIERERESERERERESE
jgi:hypothetical protein